MMNDVKFFERDGIQWASMTFLDRYTEVPMPAEGDWRDGLNCLLDIPMGAGYDHVWYEGEIIRTDTFTDDNQDTVATAAGYRKPYGKPLVSHYKWNDRAGLDAKMREFNIPRKERKGLAHWWATKGDDLLKVVRVVDPGWARKPTAPGQQWVFASIYDRDGVDQPQKDMFVRCVSEQMRDFCDREGLQYPIGDEVKVQPWCFGVIWNSDTGEIEGVKGYVRYRL